MNIVGPRALFLHPELTVTAPLRRPLCRRATYSSPSGHSRNSRRHCPGRSKARQRLRALWHLRNQQEMPGWETYAVTWHGLSSDFPVYTITILLSRSKNQHRSLQKVTSPHGVAECVPHLWLDTGGTTRRLSPKGAINSSPGHRPGFEKPHLHA